MRQLRIPLLTSKGHQPGEAQFGELSTMTRLVLEHSLGDVTPQVESCVHVIIEQFKFQFAGKLDTKS